MKVPTNRIRKFSIILEVKGSNNNNPYESKREGNKGGETQREVREGNHSINNIFAFIL